MAGMLGAPVWASTQKKEVNAREEVQMRGNYADIMPTLMPTNISPMPTLFIK